MVHFLRVKGILGDQEVKVNHNVIYGIINHQGVTMKRLDLIKQIIARKEQLNITIENLAKLSGLGVRTVNRVLANEDVKLSTIESITNLLGLDFAGNETILLEELKKQRAKSKAIFMASLVQSTSALEMQGLDNDNINNIISMYEKEFLNGEYQNTLWIA
jgi:transcriptional regulator with XRE-family HTH domain